METLAADVRVDYGKTKAPKDIVDMVKFMEALYAIKVPDLDSLLRVKDFVRPKNFFSLADVDYVTRHVGVCFFLAHTFKKIVCKNYHRM